MIDPRSALNLDSVFYLLAGVYRGRRAEVRYRKYSKLRDIEVSIVPWAITASYHLLATGRRQGIRRAPFPASYSKTRAGTVRASQPASTVRGYV